MTSSSDNFGVIDISILFYRLSRWWLSCESSIATVLDQGRLDISHELCLACFTPRFMLFLLFVFYIFKD